MIDSQSYVVKNKHVVDEGEGLLTLDELSTIKCSVMTLSVWLFQQAGKNN